MMICNRCRINKSLDEFYFDKRRGAPRAICKECFKINSRQSKRDPAKRAAYRRRIGAVTCEYIPQAVRKNLAIERNRSKLSDHSAHVRQWNRINMRQAKKNAIHDAHVSIFKNPTIQYALRYKNDSKFADKERHRIQHRKASQLYPKLDDLIRDAINRCGRSPTIERVCGYSIPEVRRHLESKFTSTMSWSAFEKGEIHIDHVIPKAMFDLSNLEQVRACWALDNLQPLWAQENIEKGLRLDWVRSSQAA